MQFNCTRIFVKDNFDSDIPELTDDDVLNESKLTPVNGGQTVTLELKPSLFEVKINSVYKRDQMYNLEGIFFITECSRAITRVMYITKVHGTTSGGKCGLGCISSSK